MKYRVMLILPIGDGCRMIAAFVAADHQRAPFPVTEKRTAMAFEDFNAAEDWQRQVLRKFGQTRHTEIVVSRE